MKVGRAFMKKRSSGSIEDGKLVHATGLTSMGLSILLERNYGGCKPARSGNADEFMLVIGTCAHSMRDAKGALTLVIDRSGVG
jgi:hypothetical protein